MICRNIFVDDKVEDDGNSEAAPEKGLGARTNS